MDNNLKAPIILIGNYRSGTSITQNLIGLHPDIAAWYEPRTMWLYADPGRGHDEFDESDATHPVTLYIRQRFLAYQMRHGNRRVMEKTPGNVLRVPYVRAIFPEATFLHMTRNPFSVISSMESKWQRTKTLRGIRRSISDTPTTQLPYYLRQFLQDMVRKKILRRKYVSIYGPRYKGIEEDLRTMSRMRVVARQWAIGNRKARQDLAELEPGRVLSFRYEQLMAAPRETFRGIYDHCRLAFTPDMLDKAEQMVDPGRQDKWHRLEPAQLKAVLPEIEDEMRHCGYDLPLALQ